MISIWHYHYKSSCKKASSQLNILQFIMHHELQKTQIFPRIYVFVKEILQNMKNNLNYWNF